ncbi:MAG: LysE family translocator [Deltaproteobacteria bacterium]|uniref:LysE family translocator n=1 Tax=Desulfobacula sp. TaxID=2593537 RepID=UPI00199197EA|nr:LysE family translocator [Candidatus Desulfobacula maris]MBL6995771.1 LysE family translocator [Desulfobacula sp.]
MSLLSIFSLAIAMFILAATPGPGVFATISRSLASGFVPSLAVIAGIVTGDIIFLLFAIMGMSVIAQAMGNFFVVIKIVGAAYLIFIGIKIWRSKPVQVQEIKGGKNKNYGNFLSGLFITLSNPKVILFYCGFLPTFMDLSSLGPIDICIVAITISIVLSSVLIFYAYLANQARVFFSSTGSVKRLYRTAGGVMIVAGVAIAAKS